MLHFTTQFIAQEIFIATTTGPEVLPVAPLPTLAINVDGPVTATHQGQGWGLWRPYGRVRLRHPPFTLQLSEAAPATLAVVQGGLALGGAGGGGNHDDDSKPGPKNRYGVGDPISPLLPLQTMAISTAWPGDEYMASHLRDPLLQARAAAETAQLEPVYRPQPLYVSLVDWVKGRPIQDFTVNEWSDLSGRFENIRSSAEQVQSAQDIERLIHSLSDLMMYFYEAQVKAIIAHSQNTADPHAKSRKEKMDEIEAQVKKAQKEIEGILFRSQYFKELPDDPYACYKAQLGCELEFHTAANVDRELRLKALETRATTVISQIMVKIGDAGPITLPKARALLNHTDRGIRRQAWQAIQAAILDVREELDHIYDDILVVTHQIATDPTLARHDFNNYRDYVFARHLYDFSVADLEAFHTAVETHVVPMLRKARHRHATSLGLDATDYQPWDEKGTPAHLKPLKAFDPDDMAGFLDKIGRVLSRLEHGLFKKVFDEIVEKRQCDVGTREGKRAGAFAARHDISGTPFFFVNNPGTSTGLWQVMHELSHGVHYSLTRHIPLLQSREMPGYLSDSVAFALELMSMRYWDEFYQGADLDRAREEHLEWFVELVCWTATVDAYEHWNYTHPGHAKEQRDVEFLRIARRFGFHDVDVDATPNWAEDERLQALLNRIKTLHHTYREQYLLRYATTYGFSAFQALRLYGLYQAALDEEQRRVVLERFLQAQKMGNLWDVFRVFEKMGVPFELGDETMRGSMQAVAKELDGYGVA